MKIPDLDQMIAQAEMENSPSIADIIENPIDLSLGLYTIEYALRTMQNQDPKYAYDLSVLDTIDKWAFREKNLNIHNSVTSLIYELVRGTFMESTFQQYLIAQGPFPPANYAVPIELIYNCILKLRQENYEYYGSA